MNDLTTILSNVPAHAKNAKSAAMQAMAAGLSGGGFGNRISLRGMKFRLIQNGTDTGAVPTPHLDVVIFALANSVQRTYYKGTYVQGSKDRPVCFSHDGKTPSPESPELQSETCALCPQNVKGSGNTGNTKACAYKKRVIILSPDDLEGDAYALDVNAQSMFGDQLEAQNKFSFKGYFEKLSLHGVDIAAIVTRLAFDDAASVAKLHFTPLRVLTADEFAVVQGRVEDETVQLMLKDLTNDAETEAPEPTKPAARTAPKPVVAKPVVQAQPAPEPEAPKGVGGLKRGFAGQVTPNPAPPPAGAGGGGNGVKKGLTIDLDALTSFDD